MKQCTKCKKPKEPTEFTKDYSKSRREYLTVCKQCHKEYRKKYSNKWRKDNPDKVKHNYIKLRYGITLEEYTSCMNTSDVCEHCGSSTELCYDHDHTTMKFRGVLCNKCNRALGLLGDTKEDIIKMLKYLCKDDEESSVSVK